MPLLASSTPKMEPVNQTAAKINTALANVIKGAASEAGLAQPDLAELTGIPLTTLQRVLAGNTKIHVQYLAQIAAALNEDPRVLLDRALVRTTKMPDVAIEMSEAAPKNVTSINRPKTAEEFDNYSGSKAATEKDESAFTPDHD